jgi:hypothetical protein
MGIGVATAENVIFDNARILHSHSGGFDLEIDSSDGHMKNVEIRNSYVNASHQAFAIVTNPTASNVYIHDNHVKFSVNSWPWVYAATLAQSTNIRIDNNVVENKRAEVPSIILTDVTNAEVKGNVAYEGTPPDVRAGETLNAVTLKNVTGTIIVAGNDFAGDTNVVNGDSLSTPWIACGNRVASGGAFDQPSRCASPPPALPPPPQAGGAEMAPNAVLRVTRGPAGSAPHTVVVDLSNSTDTDRTPIRTYTVGMAGGTWVGPQTDPTYTFTYSSAGTYDVIAAVTDSAGLSSISEQTITVS